MRLYSLLGLRGDGAKQFIYNWQSTPEDDLALDQGNSRKDNGREEKWTSLAVMLYQGIAKKTQAN